MRSFSRQREKASNSAVESPAMLVSASILKVLQDSAITGAPPRSAKTPGWNRPPMYTSALPRTSTACWTGDVHAEER